MPQNESYDERLMRFQERKAKINMIYHLMDELYQSVYEVPENKDLEWEQKQRIADRLGVIRTRINYFIEQLDKRY
jgi:hypothetical protein